MDLFSNLPQQLDELSRHWPGLLAAAGYAEIHYKFKLPWSPLFRAEPELIADAPSLVMQGKRCPLFLVMRDGDRFPARIQSIEAVMQCPTGEQLTERFEPQYELREPFKTLEFELHLPEAPGEYRLNLRIDWELLTRRKRDKQRTSINWNYPTLPPIPLTIKRLGEPFPVPPHWKGGDLHLHTTATSSPVEFGGDPAMLQSAAAALGLDWFACTDHSYDFRYRSESYQTPIDPQQKRDRLLEELAALDPNGPLALPGEEVSCGNVFGENVHLLVLGNRHHIEGNGDGGRRWLNNRPDLTIAQVLEQAAGLPCYAAHPRVKIGFAERKIFRRGQWHPEDLHPGLTGLQFWNGSTESDFLMGRAFWVKQLIQGKRLLPAGGTDSHGDLNRTSGVKMPLLSLWANHNHRMGAVRTWVPIDGALDQEKLLNGLLNGPTLVSNGPWVELQLENSAAVRLVAKSSSDFGAIRRVVLFTALRGAVAEMAQSIDPQSGASDLSHYVELRVVPRSDARYLRAELHTVDGARAISSPVWFDEPALPN